MIVMIMIVKEKTDIKEYIELIIDCAECEYEEAFDYFYNNNCNIVDTIIDMKENE